MKLGEKVKFLGGRTPKYYTDYDGIPEHMIIHGYSTLYSPETIGTVEHLYKGFVIVSFESEYRKITQLGFKSKNLISLETYEIY